MYYVLTSNTSWVNAPVCVFAGGFATHEEAVEHTKFNGYRCSDLLSEAEAEALAK
jgi:hypothetical protein